QAGYINGLAIDQHGWGLSNAILVSCRVDRGHPVGMCLSRHTGLERPRRRSPNLRRQLDQLRITPLQCVVGEQPQVVRLAEACFGRTSHRVRSRHGTLVDEGHRVKLDPGRSTLLSLRDDRPEFLLELRAVWAMKVLVQGDRGRPLGRAENNGLSVADGYRTGAHRSRGCSRRRPVRTPGLEQNPASHDNHDECGDYGYQDAPIPLASRCLLSSQSGTLTGIHVLGTGHCEAPFIAPGSRDRHREVAIPTSSNSPKAISANGSPHPTMVSMEAGSSLYARTAATEDCGSMTLSAPATRNTPPSTRRAPVEIQQAAEARRGSVPTGALNATAPPAAQSRA